MGNLLSSHKARDMPTELNHMESYIICNDTAQPNKVFSTII